MRQILRSCPVPRWGAIMSKEKSLQVLIQDFFVRHLAIERNVSPNTIASYRDAMKLFLRHSAELDSRSPDELDHQVLDSNRVRAFLIWLRDVRKCASRTRNQRLAVLKSFARYVANVAPEHLERCRLIREIRPARFETPPIRYLTENEVVSLIAGTNVATSCGRRDRALLLLLYNTGARVQEIIDLNIDDIESEPIPFVRMIGKGRKPRTAPLWSRTIKAIRAMLTDRVSAEKACPLFVSVRGRRLSRSGVTYILRKAQEQSGVEPQHTPRVAPHVLRHTTAMHLLRSGVDITTIAAWLGHANLATTHSYVEVDLRTKQAVLAASSPLDELSEATYPSPDIVDWLEDLGSRPRYAQRRGHDRGLSPRARSPSGFHSA